MVGVNVFRKLKRSRKKAQTQPQPTTEAKDDENRTLETPQIVTGSDLQQRSAAIPPLDGQTNHHHHLLGDEIVLSTDDGTEYGTVTATRGTESMDNENDTSSKHSIKDQSGGGDATTAIVALQRQPLSPTGTTPLHDSVHVWIHAVERLARSPEMHNVLMSSKDLLCSAAITGRDIAVSTGGTMVHIACLPVTVPFHVASATTDLVIGTAGNVLDCALGKKNDSSNGGEDTSSEPPLHGLVRNIWNVVPVVLGAAGHITGEIGSAAVHLVAPVLGLESDVDNAVEGDETVLTKSPRSYETSSGESSAEQRDSFLDRLRLDIHLPESATPDLEPHQQQQQQQPQPAKSLADYSKFLLRVDDLNVLIPPDPASAAVQTASRALYVDLSTDFSDEVMTTDAMTQLVQRGMNIALTNGEAHQAISHGPISDPVPIQWKPEGATGKHIRKLTQLSEPEMYKKLQKHILVWSGKYNGPSHYGSDSPIFLARGVVKRSPREFLNMLWDSNRTTEYNNYCLGRSDVLIIDDTVPEGGDYGTKVIRSETKVPFMGFSIPLCALMHARTLQDEDNNIDNDEPEKVGRKQNEKSFIIVSRSLDSGTAGIHIDDKITKQNCRGHERGRGRHNNNNNKKVEVGNKNEILLGVNILRPIPNLPGYTDLISVSQVNASMVPQFLAFRIGMMGVEDFFNNVREKA